MIKAVKEKFFNLIKRQDGVALPAVLAMFAIGSLLIVPSINYVATNLKAGSMAREEFKGIIAADAGIEDALWKIKYETPASEDLPYSYTVTGVNDLSVDVTIDTVSQIAGISLDEGGGHVDWFTVNSTAAIRGSIRPEAGHLRDVRHRPGRLFVRKDAIDSQPPKARYRSSAPTFRQIQM